MADIRRKLPRFDLVNLNEIRSTMKARTLLMAFGLACSSFVFAQSDVFVGTVTNELVDITITPNTSRDQLARMQRDLYEQGITFRYDNISWIEGELVSITLGLKDAEAGISEVFSTEDLGGSTTAIRVFMDRSDNAPTPIYVGEANAKQ